MRVTMYWYGGISYAVPNLHCPDDAEVFHSIKDAKRSFASRLWDSYYPCVTDNSPEDGGPEAWLFIGGKPSEHPLTGDYPDRIMRFGKRGAVLVERC